MNYFHLKIGIAAILVGISQADAAVISRDWKAPGDGLLTYDTVNKREWLDLSQTLLTDQFPGTGLVEKYQFVLSQTGSGGLFEGFTLAESTDVIALAQSAGIDTSTQNLAVNSGPTLLIGELLGFTVPPSNSSKISIGLISEFENEYDTIPLSAVFWTLSSQAGLIFGTAHAQFGAPPGLMFSRNVPEPNTLILIVFIIYRSILIRK